MQSRLFICLILAASVTMPISQSWAKVFYAKKGAMKLAFPSATQVKAKHLFLTHKQVKQVQKMAQARVSSRLLTVYVGYKKGKLLGYAFIDTHRVRTLPETFMVVLTPKGRIKGVHILVFNEPLEYLPPKRWFGQFKNKRLQPSLRLRRGVAGIAGATLSAQAVTRGIRKVLACFRILLQKKISKT